MGHHTAKSFIRDLGPMKLIAGFQRIQAHLKAPSVLIFYNNKINMKLA